MRKKTLLIACVDAVRAFIKESGEPSEDHWRAFCQNHALDSGLKDNADALVSWLPDACEALVEIIQDSLESRENKLVASVALNYVLMPFDVIPDEEGQDGYYGFLDDAVIVGECMKAMLRDCPPMIRKLHERADLALESIQDAFPLKSRQLLDRQLSALQSATLTMNTCEDEDQ